MNSEAGSTDIKEAAFIAIGASAGGVSAVRSLIRHMRSWERLRLPIGIVQHLPSHARLDVGLVYGSRTISHIIEVEDKMPIEVGHIYMAAPGYHLLIEKDLSFSLSQDEHVMYSRPSIDVFFESVAEVFGNKAVGVLLTGANSDGARGLKAIRDSGGYAIVQDPYEAECDVMPRSAIGLFKPDRIASLEEIGRFLSSLSHVALESAHENQNFDR